MIHNTYFYKGLSGENFNDAKTENNQIAEQQKNFNTQLNAILGIQEKEKRITALRDFTNTPVFEQANSNQIMAVYIAFRDNGSFDDMIQLYNQVENEDFKQAPMVREFLSVAYNKTNKPNQAIAVASDLIKEQKASGDVYGSLGKAFLMKFKEAKKEGKPVEEQNGWMKFSADAYEKGFMEYMEFYPGINAVYRQIDLGKIDRARKMAQIVYFSCNKEGASETKDYWCATTKLEASCIAGMDSEHTDKALKELMTYNVPDWQFETTRDTLKWVNEKIKSPTIDKIIGKIDSKLNSQDVSSKDISEQKQISVEDSLIAHSYSYRGLASNFEGSNTVSGNFKFGGQLPDHAISRKDIALFGALLDEPFEKLFPSGDCPKNLDPKRKFNDIVDTKEFLRTVDTFIRYHYGTENFIHSGLHLEDNAEIQNSVYDGAVDTIINLSGKQKNASSDSKTNISALFALGLGDCRHHANVKQIMFDTWQERQMDACLKTACNELLADDPHYEKTIRRFHQLQNMELRTFDVRVNMPIEMNGLYDPKRSEDGRYIHSDQPACLEEHTLNMLLIRDLKNSTLRNLYVCDAFYQNQYDWKEYRVKPEDIRVDEKGNFSLPAGQVKSEKVDSKEALPITLEPTVYAGRKDKVTKADTGDSITLLGIELEGLNTPQDFITRLQHRPDTEKALKKLLIADGKPVVHNPKKKNDTLPQIGDALFGRN